MNQISTYRPAAGVVTGNCTVPPTSDALAATGEGRQLIEPGFHRTNQPEPGTGKGTLRRGAGGIEPFDRVAPRGGNGDALRGHDLVERVEPSGVSRPIRRMTIAQQPRTLAHCMLIGRDSRGVGGVEAEHQAVKKPPPRRGTLDEQPILLRG